MALLVNSKQRQVIVEMAIVSYSGRGGLKKARFGPLRSSCSMDITLVITLKLAVGSSDNCISNTNTNNKYIGSVVLPMSLNTLRSSYVSILPDLSRSYLLKIFWKFHEYGDETSFFETTRLSNN